MSAALLHHILMKRAQVASTDVDGYPYSRLLPPNIDPVAPAPAAVAPKPAAPPIAAKPKAYIPPLGAGQQTAAQRAVRQAALKAQGGQGTIKAPLPPGYGPQPR